MTSTFLVIGASTGLGRETARALAREHRVVIAGRNPEADVKVDLRSLADIARAAGERRALGPFAGIVCNAGRRRRRRCSPPTSSRRRSR